MKISVREEDPVRLLAHIQRDKSVSNPRQKARFPMLELLIRIICICTILIALFLFMDESDLEKEDLRTVEIEKKVATITKNEQRNKVEESKPKPKHEIKSEADDNAEAETNSKLETELNTKKNQSIFLNFTHLVNLLDLSLEEVSKDVHDSYGTYLNDYLFNASDSSIPNTITNMFLSSTNSSKRMSRRLQLKILTSNLYPDNKNPTTFIWQTGGHSAAAAHGNLFNESYTAEMERTVQKSFNALNVSFHAYNYAMGGMSSNPELAVCQESVYGPNIDVLSWDFGMTDGRDTTGITLWGRRAAIHPTRPLLFGFPGPISSRRDALFNLETQANLSSFVLDQPKLDILRRSFPNSDVSDYEKLPYALKGYMCSGKVEVGDICGPEKYDTSKYCSAKVRSQVGWHPGWKDHKLVGKLLGLFLLHQLKRALTELQVYDISSSQQENTDFNAYLDHLLEEERLEHEYYKNNINSYNVSSPEIPQAYSKVDPAAVKSITHVLFFRQSVCRTLLLPSHARYNNIPFEGLYQKELEEGIPRNAYSKTNKGNPLTVLPLIHNKNDNSQTPCNIQLDLDFKDFFLVGRNDTNITKLPNEVEMKNYFHTSDNLENKVAVLIVLLKFDWGKYPGDYIKIDDINSVDNEASPNKDPIANFLLNGENVTSVEKVDPISFFLKNKDGGIEFDIDIEKGVDLSFQVFQDNKYFYISSLVPFIW